MAYYEDEDENDDYDCDGYNSDGFDRNGIDIDGYNRQGYLVGGNGRNDDDNCSQDEESSFDKTDSDVSDKIEKILNQLNRSKNAEKITRLLNGDISDYSHANTAGCALVGFLRSACNDNFELIFEIFSRSGMAEYKEWKDPASIGKLITKLLKTPILRSSNKTSNGGYNSDGYEMDEPSTVESFEEPICPEKAQSPSFPVSAFPSDIADYVQSVAKSRKVSPDLPAMLVLGATAAAASKKIRVCIGNTHHEPVNLYILPAAESAERKSSVFDDIFFPVENEERRLLEAGRSEYHRARQEYEITKKRIEIMQRSAAKAKEEKERTELLRMASDLSCGLTEPISPKLIVGGDITPEALSTKLLQQHGKIVLLDTEGGFFQKINGQYARNGQANLDAVLKGHSGTDIIRVSRQGRPDEYVDKPALTLVICVQPIVIQSLAQNGDFRGKGLLARFLYSFPPSLAGTRFYEIDNKVDDNAKYKYQNIISSIFKIKPAEHNDEIDYTPETKLKITGNALAQWKKIHDKIETKIGKGGELHEMADWCGKYAGLVARISGLLHTLDHATSSSIPEQICKDVIIRAEQIVDYLLEHAKTAYGLMGAKKDLSRALQIMSWLQKKGKTEFTANEVLRDHAHWGNVDENILPSLMLLCDRNILNNITPEKKGRGRPARYKFKLNPTCINCNKCLASSQIGKKKK